MNTVIWVLLLEIQDTTIVQLPACADFLCVQVPHDIPCLWFRIQATEPLANYRISIVTTGQPCNHTLCMDYVGTFQLVDFIGHVFIKRL